MAAIRAIQAGGRGMRDRGLRLAVRPALDSIRHLPSRAARRACRWDCRETIDRPAERGRAGSRPRRRTGLEPQAQHPPAATQFQMWNQSFIPPPCCRSKTCTALPANACSRPSLPLPRADPRAAPTASGPTADDRDLQTRLLRLDAPRWAGGRPCGQPGRSHARLVAVSAASIRPSGRNPCRAYSSSGV